MYRFFVLVTLLSFLSGSYAAQAMEAPPEENGGHLTRQPALANDLTIETKAETRSSQLIVSDTDPIQDEGADTSQSRSVTTSPEDMTAVVTIPTNNRSIFSILFFWQSNDTPEDSVIVRKASEPLRVEDFVIMDCEDPSGTGGTPSSLALIPYDPLSSGMPSSSSLALVPYVPPHEEETFPYPSLMTLTEIDQNELVALALLKNESLERFERMIGRHPDAPLENQQGMVLYQSREGARRHMRLLDLVDQTQEGIKSGQIIPPSDPHYYLKHGKKYMWTGTQFALDLGLPVVGAITVRGLSNVILSEWGLKLAQAFGFISSRGASKAVAFLTRFDITGITPRALEIFFESQARAEGYRRLGSAAALVEKYGLTVVLTGARLGAATFDYTSSAVKGTYNAVGTAAQSAYSGTCYMFSSLKDGTMYVFSFGASKDQKLLTE